MPPPKIITLEGNIGSGKSTLQELLKQHYSNLDNVVFVPEPVDEWELIKDKNGITILQKFYADQERYAFAFQMMAYISRLTILQQLIKKHADKPNLVLISERSLYTDKFIFAKMLFDQGKIDEVSYQIYLTWFDVFAADYPVAHRIYISTAPEICHQRIAKRGRTGEDVIPFTYLQQCHAYHEDYINAHDDTLILDGNVNINQDKNVLNEWLTSIDHLIQTP